MPDVEGRCGEATALQQVDKAGIAANRIPFWIGRQENEVNVAHLEDSLYGSPIIILTNDGFIYFPISADMPDSGQRAKMMPFVGKYVQAT
ncbi:MAG: hypothetical protein DMG93_21470, partial [Acidobacteria bacterium]